MTTTPHRLYAPIIPGARKQRHRGRKINYWSALAGYMARAPLLKMYESGKPTWSVGRHAVDALLVQQAIASGHLVAREPGLFGDGDAQTWQINPAANGPPPQLPPTRNVEAWVRRALRLKCAVCGGSVYSDLRAARADIERVLTVSPTINDLKSALADTDHGGRLCHVHM